MSQNNVQIWAHFDTTEQDIEQLVRISPLLQPKMTILGPFRPFWGHSEQTWAHLDGQFNPFLQPKVAQDINTQNSGGFWGAFGGQLGQFWAHLEAPK